MKKIKYSTLYSIAILFTLSFLSSCKKDFLEVSPKGKLIAETTEDYQKSLYVGANLNQSTTAEIYLGDEVASLEPYFSSADKRAQNLFKWEADLYRPDENSIEMEVPMQQLYLYNKIINEVMDSKGGTDAEKNAIMAQAKTGRAIIYFLLINYYGKPYEASSAATDPGFPIITKADVTENSFKRASVKEVYDLIIDDLSSSLVDLPKQISHRLQFSRTVGEMALGKTLMFMGNFNQALPHFDEAFTYMANSSIPVKLYDYNLTMAPGGSMEPDPDFGPFYPGAESIQENILARQALNYWAFFLNDLVLSKETVALFGTDDLRKNWYSNSKKPLGIFKRVAPFTIQYGYTVPDLYLLRAETRARMNNLNGARQDLEALRSKRMPNGNIPNAIATDKPSLIKFILEERIREFAGLGFRWFDMRRLSVDPEFSSTIKTTHKVYDQAGNQTADFTLDPKRYVLRFSPKVMQLNPGLENNP